MKFGIDEEMAQSSWGWAILKGLIKPPPSSTPPSLEETLPPDLLEFPKKKK